MPQAGVICRPFRRRGEYERDEGLIVATTTHCERVSGCFLRKDGKELKMKARK
jgi:hypothetical protein